MRIFALALLLVCASVCRAQTPSALDLSLFDAVQKSDIERATSLLKCGANPNAYQGSTPLLYAALLNADPAMTQILLQAGADPNATSGYGERVLTQAFGDADKLRLLIDAGADLKRDGEQTLLYAASYGHLEPLHILLNRGVSANASSAREGVTSTALMLAVSGYSGDQSDVVRLLLQRGARVNFQNQLGETALMKAAASFDDHSPTIRLLLKAGARLEERDQNGETALMKAVAASGGMAPVLALLAAGADIEARDDAGGTVLMKAATSGKREKIALVLGRGVSVNARDKGGETALMKAIGKGDVEVIKTLLRAGADVRARDQNGGDVVSRLESRTYEPMVAILEKFAPISPEQRARLRHLRDNLLLLKAANQKDLARVRELLQKGADPNARRWNGGTVLLETTFGGRDKDANSLNIVLTRLLLESGADPNLSDDKSYPPTPLMNARANTTLLAMLLNAGARVDARDERGHTALMELCRRRYATRDALRKLLEAGADPNARNGRGQTALMLASSRSYYSSSWNSKNIAFRELVEQLQKAGADINAADKEGQTALILAAHDQETNAVPILLQSGADIESQDRSGRTPLMAACQVFTLGAMSSGSGNSYSWPLQATVQLLLKQGADPNVRDKVGQTALVRVAKMNPKQDFPRFLDKQQIAREVESREARVTAIARLLIEQGADVSLRTNNGNTALKWAKVRGNQSLVQLIEKTARS